ncbi:hypothetical protein AAG570_012347 [Ranatra chinensis]|uniref:Uncharacterized protein n=1 Tax=Ranatra chinensis TaxID=642074 RepID=A0ABD0YIS9_9HEMI
MASKRRNMFYQNKKQETTEISRFSELQAANRRKIILLREFQACRDVKSNIKFLSLQVDMIGGGRTALSAKFEVTKTIERINKLMVTANKCPSYAENDKCEFFMRVPVVTNFCGRLREEKQLWSPIVKAVRPEIKCPMPKGVYDMQNLTFDPQLLGSVMKSVDKNYWLLNTKLFEDNSLIFCMNWGGEEECDVEIPQPLVLFAVGTFPQTKRGALPTKKLTTTLKNNTPETSLPSAALDAYRPIPSLAPDTAPVEVAEHHVEISKILMKSSRSLLLRYNGPLGTPHSPQIQSRCRIPSIFLNTYKRRARSKWQRTKYPSDRQHYERLVQELRAELSLFRPIPRTILDAPEYSASSWMLSGTSVYEVARMRSCSFQANAKSHPFAQIYALPPHPISHHAGLRDGDLGACSMSCAPISPPWVSSCETSFMPPFFYKEIIFDMQQTGNRERIIQIRQLIDCPNSKTSAKIIWKQIDMIGGGKTAINAKFEITVAIKSITKVIVSAKKCPSFAEIDKCEFFIRIPIVTNFCGRLHEENQLWSTFVRAIHPPVRRCPVPKGVYYMRNLTFDPRIFEAAMKGADKHYWLVNAKAFDAKALAFCITVGGQITTIRAINTTQIN